MSCPFCAQPCSVHSRAPLAVQCKPSAVVSSSYGPSLYKNLSSGSLKQKLSWKFGCSWTFKLLCSIRTFCPEGPFLHLQFSFNNEEVMIGKCFALYIFSSWNFFFSAGAGAGLVSLAQMCAFWVGLIRVGLESVWGFGHVSCKARVFQYFRHSGHNAPSRKARRLSLL